MSRWIRRCIMMAPVAEMTYFDSGTIEHLTYRVVAAKEYSDGSVGGERSFQCYTRTREYSRERRRGSSISNRCHGLVAASQQFRERAFSSARVPVAANRAYLIAPFRTYSSSKTSNCLETRRSPKKRKTLGGSESEESDRSLGRTCARRNEGWKFHPVVRRPRGDSKRRREKSRGGSIIFFFFFNVNVHEEISLPAARIIQDRVFAIPI